MQNADGEHSLCSTRDGRAMDRDLQSSLQTLGAIHNGFQELKPEYSTLSMGTAIRYSGIQSTEYIPLLLIPD